MNEHHLNCKRVNWVYNLIQWIWSRYRGVCIKLFNHLYWLIFNTLGICDSIENALVSEEKSYAYNSGCPKKVYVHSPRVLALLELKFCDWPNTWNIANASIKFGFPQKFHFQMNDTQNVTLRKMSNVRKWCSNESVSKKINE